LAGRRLARREAVALAFQLEQALFATPCGRQDHLAAAYGGVHLWTWTPGRRFGYKGRKLLKGSAYPRLEARLLVAYPGQEHASAEINRTWTQGFLAGTDRAVWREISVATKNLARSLEAGRWAEAARWLQAETRLRLALTPEVLPPLAGRLVQAAEELGAGARFCGAGGGGCVWALGPKSRIDHLRPVWSALLAAVPQARLLPVRLDRLGLRLWAKDHGDQPA
jgi:D-glycero-alpha-D-manno-heptose-7-phosphate kinase